MTTLDAQHHDVVHHLPDFLPDGRHFLFLVRSSDADRTGAYVGSLDGGTPSLVVKTLGKAEYVAPGYVLFPQDGALLARRFDARTLTASGDQVQVIDQVSFTEPTGLAAFSATDTGTLAYRAAAAGSLSRLEWRSRDGTLLSVARDSGEHNTPELSPDGSRLAVSVRDRVSGSNDVWVTDVTRDVWTRMTFDQGSELAARWSPSGDRRGKPWPLVAGPFRQEYARFSPDGKWVAYQSTESGRPEIYVTPFAQPGDETTGRGAKWQVSASGGRYPRWSRDGRTLYFVTLEGRLMAANVASGGTALKVGTVQPLFTFKAPQIDYPYDVTPDGQRVLVAAGLDAPDNESIQVIVNWSPAPAR